MKIIKESNKFANKLLYIFVFIGIIPLVAVWVIYLDNASSPFLNSIADRFSSLPAVTSVKKPLMTKVMDVYCKSAPFLAIMLFLCSIKLRKFKATTNRGALIRSCLLSPFFYPFFIYFFLFRNIELTTAGRPLRLMSGQDLPLLLVYISLYAIVFFLTYGMCYIPVVAYKIFKERR